MRPACSIRRGAADTRNRARPYPVKRLLLTTASACVLLLAMSVPAHARVIELGETESTPPASCPDDCQAVGRVTGYQLRGGGVRSPFKVRQRGKIVAFSITLGDPREDQIDFFDDLFGGPASVRLVVLRPGSKLRHRLTGRSEVFEVERYFGSTPTFALSRPLTVKKGYIVAISVPTWIPSFAVNLDESEVWRSSRSRRRCDDVRQDAAHTRRGSLRTYGCNYRTARLLYTASYVPTPRPTRRERDAGSSSRRG